MTTLDNLRKSARRWLNALKAGDADARLRFDRAYPNAPARPTLRHVQHALARERGFVAWKELVAASAQPAGPSPAPLTALLAAAAAGDAGEVAARLDASPDLIDARGLLEGHIGLRTALHFGVAHEPVIRALLERGADPNIRDEGDNAFPLHFAAEHENFPVIRLLVEHGADTIGDGDGHELQVIGWAACFGTARPEIVEYLLAHGARHTVSSAVATGATDALRSLAQAGADLDRPMDRANQHRRPLHLAVVKHQPGALAALLELGADPNALDAARLTPLDTAAIAGERGMADTLLAHGAALGLPAAIGLERADDVARLLREDPEAVRAGHRWEQLIIHVSRHAPGRIVEQLLAAGASVNVEESIETSVDGAIGCTPLHAAAFQGNAVAAAVLLKHGANPRLRDRKYCATPAGWADYAGHAATRDLILEADIDIFDALACDRADRVAAILDRDPGAIDRPFRAYATCIPAPGQWCPQPDQTPLEWALARGREQSARVLVERGAGTRSAADAQQRTTEETFVEFACWDHRVHGKADHRMYDHAAGRLLAAHPEIARRSLFTAIICGEIDEVRRRLADAPDTARQAGGPRGWTPILYACYTRFSHPRTLAHAVPIARLLLDHGADPNDYYMAGDSHYTALVGAAAEGEQDAPRQPYAPELFDLLLERGADPFDVQVLYNTHFSGDVLWWLELVHARTQGTPHEAAWRDPEWLMFDMGPYGSGARFLLGVALRKRDLTLAGWILAHGANPNAAPARDHRFSKRSLYEDALLEQFPEMARLLERYGATPTTPALTDAERFRDACFRLDRDQARAMLAAHPEYLASTDAIFAAAKHDRPDVLAFLLDLGVPIEVQDRRRTRPLHAAAERNAVRAAALLIERGAEIDPREANWNATPIGFAAHGDHREVLDLLSRHSRNVATLAIRGYVDRLADVLRGDPALARQTFDDGTTLLWWLPDDEEKALRVVDLLLAAGANPAAVSTAGGTAADWARKRGLWAAADRISTAAAG